MSERRRLRLQVRGRVQGVWFRAFTKEQADALGLHGWVRNLPDGGVEVVAEGEAAALQELEARCRRGPPAARVQELARVDEGPATGELLGFTVRR